MINQPDPTQQQSRPAWSVVRVDDSTMFNGPQGITPAKTITVRLNTDGSTFTVQVPVAQFNAGTVSSMIEQQAADELEIRGLQSSTYL